MSSGSVGLQTHVGANIDNTTLGVNRESKDFVRRAAGDVGAEIPVETFAEQTAGDEADALEELEAGLIEEIVFMVNIGTWKAEDVVETDAFLGYNIFHLRDVFLHCQKNNLGIYLKEILSLISITPSVRSIIVLTNRLT